MAGHDFRSRKRLLALDVEGTSGTEETLTVADGVVVEDLTFVNQFETDESNEHTGTLDRGGPIPAGGTRQFTFTALGRGAGVAGTAPDYAAALRAAALSQTLLAAAVADTAQAGAASTITLHSGASATDNAYLGMVIRTIAGTGPGQVRVITAYNGTSKVATVYPAWSVQPDATTTFSIDAAAVYQPVSDDVETATAYLWHRHKSASSDAVLEKLVGAAGTFSMTLAARRALRVAFTLQGLYAGRSDVSDPGALAAPSVDPPVFMAAEAFLGGAPVKIGEFTLDYGATLENADDPAGAFGYDIGEVVERAISGRINPRLVHMATRNAFDDFTSGTTHPLWLRWGSAAGNRFSLFLPAIQYSGPPEDDVQRGFSQEGLPFRAVGADAGMYLSIY